MLNKVKQGSNMYPFLNDYPRSGANRGYTWNPIKGKCPHDCSYCYMKVFPQGELRLDSKALLDYLGADNFIFVGSSTDMFADKVPKEWIEDVLERCSVFKKNRYLFQTKNPARFHAFDFPDNSILGITLETDIWHEKEITKAPSPYIRKEFISVLDYDKMISIEPIMEFQLDVLVHWIADIQPKFVSIGADSKGHNLPEPNWDKVQELIKELKKFTEVKVKDNLMRLKKCQ